MGGCNGGFFCVVVGFMSALVADTRWCDAALCSDVWASRRSFRLTVSEALSF
jgi:hypothetical protein